MPLSAAQTEAVLERWRAQEAALPRRAPGVVPLAEFAARPGITVFEAMLRGEVPPAPMAHTLDFALVEAEPGRVVFQGRPGRAHHNPAGGVHGGWYATLLDSALGCAVHTALPPGRAYTTVELKLNIVKALGDKVPLVRAEGRLIHLGRSLGTADGRLVGPDGTLYAHASTTCLVMDAPAPKAA